MTDSNTCDHPTADGTPCELPATRSDGRCHHHTDAEERRNGGREWAISEDDHEDILDAAEQGLSKSGCARSAGASLKSLRRYLDEHPDFRRSFARARARGEQRLARAGLVDPETDTQMAKFLLSTSFDYIKTEKREVENTGDDPLAEIVVDFEDADT